MAPRERWHPPSFDKDGKGFPNTYDKADIRAIQSLVVYAATGGDPPSASEVKRALDWIIEKACLTFDEPFEAGRPDVRDYLLGRRSVGLALIKLMKLKPEKMDHD